jgi:beta-lactamase class A
MKMKTYKSIYILLMLLLVLNVKEIFPQFESARTKIADIIKESKGTIGVAVMDLENRDTLTFNNNHCFPMQSAYKFPLALAVLNKVDKKDLSLDQKIHLTKKDLLPNTWSPLREKYPDADVDVTLRELIRYTVMESDNNGCDILFRLIGGPAEVEKYLKSLGINDMSIVGTEEEMHKDWSVQYKNCSSPFTMVSLLYKFSEGNILSKESRDFLWTFMTQTPHGAKRIKGQLPEGTIVAHKTGSSGTNEEGITAATNDVGIVLLPDGRKFAIVVFVSDSPDKNEKLEKIIADITKDVWDTYSIQMK